MYILFCLTALSVLVYGLLIEWSRRSWNSIPLPRATTQLRPGPPAIRVTVLVPARNEELHLEGCLRSLFNQTYPAQYLQIIVINDHSTDQTQALVEAHRKPHLVLLNLQDLLPPEQGVRAHKKKAIEVGVRHATGELIVTTDADCQAPAGWIAALVEAYQQWSAAFIAAPVKLTPGAGLLSIFQTLDFIALQGITGATVHAGTLTMCNGANLAYSKQAFQTVDGFAGIDQIPSGDDMLLMHKIAQRFTGRVFFLKSVEAQVSTQPMSDWASFLNQRIRWSSKAEWYGDRRIFWALLGVYLLNLMLVVFAVASCFSPGWLAGFAVLILAKTAFEFPFMYQVARFFGQQRLMRYFLFLQPLHLIYIVVVGLLGKFSGYEWKGRRLN